MGRTYEPAFYATHAPQSISSAQAIVPIVMRLVQPRSVVDLGCGTGAWLGVFRDRGVAELVGVDGHHLTRDELLIPPELFTAHDLTRPLPVDRRFDLAISLEVAEHLPAQAASGFVGELCRLSDVVLFSAAVPGQGGVHHINERWQSYWVDRFAERSYEAVDCIRPLVWDDAGVAPWYAQNAFVFVHRGTAAADQVRAGAASLAERAWPPPDLVNPRMYESSAAVWARRDPERLAPRQLLPLLVRASARAAHRRLEASRARIRR